VAIPGEVLLAVVGGEHDSLVEQWVDFTNFLEFAKRGMTKSDFRRHASLKRNKFVVR
jgi:hypothetical protein